MPFSVKKLVEVRVCTRMRACVVRVVRVGCACIGDLTRRHAWPIRRDLDLAADFLLTLASPLGPVGASSMHTCVCACCRAEHESTSSDVLVTTSSWTDSPVSCKHVFTPNSSVNECRQTILSLTVSKSLEIVVSRQSCASACDAFR